MAGLSAIFSLILTRIATVSNSRSDEAMGRPPLIYEGPRSDTTTYHVGSRVILPCRAHGTPPIQYDWYQNEKLLNTSTDPESTHFLLDGTLHLKTEPSQNDGYYQCLAINDYGVDMSNISHLQEAVFQGPHHPRRTVHNRSVTEGHLLVLPCNHVTSTPPATVTWFTGNSSTCDSHVKHAVHANNRMTMNYNGDLVFPAVTQADAGDNLLYKCEAYNYVTRQTEGSNCTRIIIKESYNTHHRPELIYSSATVPAHKGTNVTLTCLFSGRPIPTIQWTRVGNGSALLPAPTDSGRRLVLSHVSLEDEGRYACSASNDKITTTYSIVSLSIVVSPRLSAALESRNVTEGASTSFSCKAEARPAPQVTWFVNARPISNDVQLSWTLQNETLTLVNLQLGDDSTVTCNVSNDFGSVLSSAYFMVLPSQSTTASLFETSADDDYYAPVVMATVTSFNDDDSIGHSTSDGSDDAYENSSSDENKETDLARTESSVSEYEFRVVDQDKWLDSNLMRCLWFSIPILLLLAFGFLVWQRYRNRKTTYRVEEQEKKHGSNNIDYDSEDSGYDEQKAERIVKKFKISEKELT